MFHRISDGDILKIFPLMRKNGEFTFCEVYGCAFTEGKMIYDTSGKNYLWKMIQKHMQSGKKNVMMSKRHVFSVYINGQIKFISVGAKLMDIISKRTYSHPNLTDNGHLSVSIEMTGSGYQSYDNSTFIEKDWVKPVTTDDAEDWKNWIKRNQPCLEDYIDKFSLHRNISILKRSLGDEFILPELIAEERDNRIEEILKEENTDLFS